MRVTLVILAIIRNMITRNTIFILFIALIFTSCKYVNKFEVLNNENEYRDQVIVTETDSVGIYYEADNTFYPQDGGAWGKNSLIRFYNNDNEVVTIDTVICKQYYKGNEITLNYEFDDGRKFPSVLCKKSDGIICSSASIRFFTNKKLSDFELGDEIKIELEIDLTIDNKPYHIQKQFTKKFLRINSTPMP